jgi:hypothetical protein
MCAVCDKIFTSNFSLNKHINNNVCKIDKKYNCDRCGKKFISDMSLHTHKNKYCYSLVDNVTNNVQSQLNDKPVEILNLGANDNSIEINTAAIIKMLSEMNLKMDIFQKELAQLNNKYNTQEEKLTSYETLSNQIATNNKEIILIKSGGENINKLTFDEKLLILKKGCYAVNKLTQLLNLNKNIPEYHNIHFSSLKDKYGKIYDGEIWNTVKKEKIIEQIYENKLEMLTELLGDKTLTDKLAKPYKKSIKKIYNYNLTDKTNNAVQEILNELQLNIYDNRHLIIQATTNKR